MPKTQNLIVTVALTLALAAGAAPLTAEEIQDATIAAPEAHSVVMENEHVRVISALASPGHQSPLHSHPPMVIISLDTARVRLTDAEGNERIANVRPGTVLWSEGGAHSWELLSGEIDIIAVEVKSARASAMAEGGDE